MAVSEYDAFGPWIYEIDADHPVPRLFAPYIPQNKEAYMLFKIPRNIERRVATPDMDLYDYVVGAYADNMTVWKREEQQVTTTQVIYTEVESVELTRHFLKGVLTLYLKKGEIALPFNAVSMDLIKRLVVYIRGKKCGQTEIVPPNVQSRQMALHLNLLFTNQLKDLMSDGEIPLLYAYQAAVERPVLKKRGLGSIFRRGGVEKIPATLHVLTPAELIVIRQDVVTVGKQVKEELLYHYSYIPLCEIRRTELRLHENCAETECAIELAHHTFFYELERDNRSVESFYALLRTYVK